MWAASRRERERDGGDRQARVGNRVLPLQV